MMESRLEYNKGSRIPRFTRSRSLREKSYRCHDLENPTIPEVATNEPGETCQSKRNTFSLTRSSSFISSRGMSGVKGWSKPTSLLIPEIYRRSAILSSSYVSPYSKTFIENERKAMGWPASGVMHKERGSLPTYYSPQIFRKRSSLPLHAYQSEIDTNDYDDDNISEKSFDSVASTRSLKIHLRPGSVTDSPPASSFWSSRPPNTLHCSQRHESERYLTPTQKLSRRIKELQAQLKMAKQEIIEKDDQIAELTRQVVESRLNLSQDLPVNISSELENSSPDGQMSIKNKLDLNLATIDSFSNSYRSRNNSLTVMPVDEDSKTCDVSSTVDSATLESGVFLSTCHTPTSEASDKELFHISTKNDPIDRLLKTFADSENGGDSNSIPITTQQGLFEDADKASNPSRLIPLNSSSESNNYPRDDCKPLNIATKDNFQALYSDDVQSEGNRQHPEVVNSGYDFDDDDIPPRNVAGTSLDEWMKKMEALKSDHVEDLNEMKQKYNDKVEMLLSKLSDANLKYFDLRPLYDKAVERLQEVERENSRLRSDMRENDIRHQQVYLRLYLKGQESARFTTAEENATGSEPDNPEVSCRRTSEEHPDRPDWYSNTVVLGLLKQLAETEDEVHRLKSSSRKSVSSFGSNFQEGIDPVVTLQFLKSAIYYFLTDKVNADGHLRAIEGILGFSSDEKGNIDRNFKLGF